MDLVQLLIILIIAGAVLFIVNRLPLDATIKMVINVIAVVVLAIVVIKALVPLAGL